MSDVFKYTVQEWNDINEGNSIPLITWLVESGGEQLRIEWQLSDEMLGLPHFIDNPTHVIVPGVWIENGETLRSAYFLKYGVHSNVTVEFYDGCITVYKVSDNSVLFHAPGNAVSLSNGWGSSSGADVLYQYLVTDWEVILPEDFDRLILRKLKKKEVQTNQYLIWYSTKEQCGSVFNAVRGGVSFADALSGVGLDVPPGVEEEEPDVPVPPDPPDPPEEPEEPEEPEVDGATDKRPNILDSGTFWEKVYERFPEVYKEMDRLNEYYLKRYIKSAGSGFEACIDEMNGIFKLLDSNNCPEYFLSNLCSAYGFDSFNGLPNRFLKGLLPYLNLLYARKGSYSTVEYLSSVVSGCKVIVTEDSDFANTHILHVAVDMDTSIADDFPDNKQLTRVIREFIPFFCIASTEYKYRFEDYYVLWAHDNFPLEREHLEILEKHVNEWKSLAQDTDSKENVKQIIYDPGKLVWEDKLLDKVERSEKKDKGIITGGDYVPGYKLKTGFKDSAELTEVESLKQNVMLDDRSEVHSLSPIKHDSDVLNSVRCTLNEFYLCSRSGYDIIHVNGETKLSYYY